MQPLDLCIWFWFVWALIWLAASFFVFKNKYRETRLERQKHGLPTVIAFLMIFYGPYFDLPGMRPLYDSLTAGYIGSTICFFGLAFAVWARAHLGKYWSGTITLKEGHRVIDTGPYRHIRHPIYTGFLAALLGAAIAAATVISYIAVVVAVVTYVFKLKREEKLLLGEFGPAYAGYMARTAALLPFVY